MMVFFGRKGWLFHFKKTETDPVSVEIFKNLVNNSCQVIVFYKRLIF